MEIHQLEYVVAIAKNKSFARAAVELSITPPALSQQIKKLEAEIGTTLFERGAHLVQITPAGAEFICYAEKIIESVYQARSAMNKYIGVESGNIKIGTFPAIGPYGIVSMFVSFMKIYPKINLVMQEGECLDIYALLERGEVDAALSTYVNVNEPMPELDYSPLVHDELVIITGKHHKFARKKYVDIKELASELFIMPLTTAGAYVDMLNACAEYGFTPVMKYQSDAIDTRFLMVAEGMGITFVSLSVANTYATTHDVAIIHIHPAIPRTLFLVTPKNIDNNHALVVFKNYCLKWAEARS